MTDDDLSEVAQAVVDAYPFPDDEFIFQSSPSFSDRTQHSYTASARLPDWHRLEVNGAPHHNSHRLVIHTPIRGPVSFLTRPRDMEGLLLTVLSIAADGEGVFGPKGEVHLHQRWLESQLDRLDIPFEFHPDENYVPKDAKEQRDE